MNAETQVIQALRHSERRYHLFKAVLILFCTLTILAVMAYEANRSITAINQKNARVESLLRCSLPGFTPQNYQQAAKILNKCLEENQ